MGFTQFLTNSWRIVNSNSLFINRCANSVLESHNTGFAQKAVVNTLQLPQKPKKPSPPFFKFLQEKRPEVTKKHNLSLKDAVRVVSEMWKVFDVDTKKKMSEMYSEELKQYKEGIVLYNKSLTDDQRNELFRVKYEQLEQKTKRKLKKELRELGKPRKPVSGYLMFVSQEIKNRGDVSVTEYMKTVANKWRDMDVNSKTKYIDAASVENDKYNDALINWENNMIKAGRLDLVRARAIYDNTEN